MREAAPVGGGSSEPPDAVKLRDLQALLEVCKGRPALAEHAAALAAQADALKAKIEGSRPPATRLREALARRDCLCGDIVDAEGAVALAAEALEAATRDLDLAKAKLAALVAAKTEIEREVASVQRGLSDALASSDAVGASAPSGASHI